MLSCARSRAPEARAAPTSVSEPGHAPPPPDTPAPGPEGRKVARHTLLSGVSEGSFVLLLVLGVVAARILGPTGWGHYQTATAFVGLFRILPDFGMAYAATLAISRDRGAAGRLLGNLLGFQVVLSVATLALCLALGARQYEGMTWFAVLVLSFDLLLKTVKATLRWLLRGLQRFGVEASSLLVERALLLAVGFVSLRAGWGVAGFVLVFVAVRLADTLGLYTFVDRRVLPLRPSVDLSLWWELFRKGVPIAYAGAVITLIFSVDTVILERLRGVDEAGLYRAPVMVLEGLNIVPRVLAYAFLPTMAAWYMRSPAVVTGLYRRGCRYLLLVGLPIAAFGVLESDRFIALVFGPKYVQSAAAAQWLLPAATFMFLSNFGETTLACVNRWGTIVSVATVSLALNIALNLAWIPSQGYMGAARATLVTELVYFLLTAAAVAYYGFGAGTAHATLRPLAAGAVFAGALWACNGLPLLTASAIASTAFVGAALFFGALERDEIDALMAAGGGSPPA
jgi:O-antigen/teichoic acid export membrane protein